MSESFAEAYRRMAEVAESSDMAMEIFGDVVALVGALEEGGHVIETDDSDAASHRLNASRYDTYCLRRTPPTMVTPYAYDPPVLRIPYVWLTDTEAGEEVAVLVSIGDKSSLGNDWYEGTAKQVDNFIVGWLNKYRKYEAKERR